MRTSEEALASFPPAQKACLVSIGKALGALLPDAIEDLSWGMPTLRCEGIIVMSYMGFTDHNSLFPGPGVIERLGDELKGHITTKGTIHLERDKAPSLGFLRRIVEARIAIINEGFPKKSGEFLALYSNGRPKARGKYKNGEMHGPWEFYRKAGGLMRAGSFAEGRQVGTWITYTAEGKPYRGKD